MANSGRMLAVIIAACAALTVAVFPTQPFHAFRVGDLPNNAIAAYRADGTLLFDSGMSCPSTLVACQSCAADIIGYMGGAQIGPFFCSDGTVVSQSIGLNTQIPAFWWSPNASSSGGPVPLVFVGGTGPATVTIPTGVTSIQVYLWGAGGAGSESAPGGAGAFVSGALAVTPGETLRLIIGKAGGYNDATTGWTNMLQGGGGAAGYNGGQGGGRTAVQRFSSGSWSDVVTAGGGGGGGGCGSAGGAATWTGTANTGGPRTGQRWLCWMFDPSAPGGSGASSVAAGSSNYISFDSYVGGYGVTASSFFNYSSTAISTTGSGSGTGPSGAVNDLSYSGSQYRGGDAHPSNCAGGGGGGWWGGATSANAGGGGGSSYTGALTAAAGQDGNGVAAQAVTLSQFAGSSAYIGLAGFGGAIGGNGGPGLIILDYPRPAPADPYAAVRCNPQAYASPCASAAPGTSAAATPSPTRTTTPSPTPTPTGTKTSGPSVSQTPTPTPTTTVTPTPTSTKTPDPAVTESNTPTPSTTKTATGTATATRSASATRSAVSSSSATGSARASTSAMGPPSVSATQTATGSAHATTSAVSTSSATRSATKTSAATSTSSATRSAAPTSSATNSAHSTSTASSTATVTSSISGTPSNTPSNSPTPSQTPSNSPTPSITPSNSGTPSGTPSPTPSAQLLKLLQEKQVLGLPAWISVAAFGGGGLIGAILVTCLLQYYCGCCRPAPPKARDPGLPLGRGKKLADRAARLVSTASGRVLVALGASKRHLVPLASPVVEPHSDPYLSNKRPELDSPAPPDPRVLQLKQLLQAQEPVQVTASTQPLHMLFLGRPQGLVDWAIGNAKSASAPLYERKRVLADTVRSLRNEPKLKQAFEVMGVDMLAPNATFSMVGTPPAGSTSSAWAGAGAGAGSASPTVGGEPGSPGSVDGPRPVPDGGTGSTAAPVMDTDVFNELKERKLRKIMSDPQTAEIFTLLKDAQARLQAAEGTIAMYEQLLDQLQSVKSEGLQQGAFAEQIAARQAAQGGVAGVEAGTGASAGAPGSAVSVHVDGSGAGAGLGVASGQAASGMPGALAFSLSFDPLEGPCPVCGHDPIKAAAAAKQQFRPASVGTGNTGGAAPSRGLAGLLRAMSGRGLSVPDANDTLSQVSNPLFATAGGHGHHQHHGHGHGGANTPVVRRAAIDDDANDPFVADSSMSAEERRRREAERMMLTYQPKHARMRRIGLY